MHHLTGAVGSAVRRLAATVAGVRTGPDTSNYTYAPTAAWDSWIDPGGIAALFPQALNPPAGYPPGVTDLQVRWGLDNGVLVVPYVWKWFGTGLSDIQRRLDLLAPFAGQIHHLMLDVEDTTVSPLAALPHAHLRRPEIVLDTTFRIVDTVRLPPEHMLRLRRQPPPVYPSSMAVSASVAAMSLQARIDELSAALEMMDQFPTQSGLPAGVYSGSWYWGPYLGNTTAFAVRPVWPAIYDNNPDVTVWTPFGGWASPAAKQFAGTRVFYGVGGVDMNALSDSYLGAAPDPGGGGSPDVDQGWLDKKDAVVTAGGELLTVADQIDDVAAQAEGLIQQLSGLTQGVRDRANVILG